MYNDHTPLTAVLKRLVGENPTRLQRMLCRIIGYNLDFKYIKGRDLLIADTLSRSHTTNHTRSQREEEIETIGFVRYSRSKCDQPPKRNCRGNCQGQCPTVSNPADFRKLVHTSSSAMPWKFFHSGASSTEVITLQFQLH